MALGNSGSMSAGWRFRSQGFGALVTGDFGGSRAACFGICFGSWGCGRVEVVKMAEGLREVGVGLEPGLQMLIRLSRIKQGLNRGVLKPRSPRRVVGAMSGLNSQSRRPISESTAPSARLG